MIGRQLKLTSFMWAAPRPGTIVKFHNRSYKVVARSDGLALRRTAWQAIADFFEDVEDRLLTLDERAIKNTGHPRVKL